MTLSFKEISFEDYTDFCQNEPRNFLQTVEMANLKEQRGCQNHYLGVINETHKIIYVALLTESKIKLGSAFDIDGLIKTKEEVMETFITGLIGFIRKKKGIYLTISPDENYRSIDQFSEVTEYAPSISKLLVAKGFQHTNFQEDYNTNGNPNTMFIKSLSGLTRETLPLSYTKKARYSIEKTKKFGMVIKELASSELGIFKEITLDHSTRVGYTDKSLAYYQKVAEIYGQNAKFLAAELNFSVYLEKLKKQKLELQQKIKKVEQQLEKIPNSKKKRNQHKALLEELEALEKRRTQAQENFESEQKETVIVAVSLFLITPYEIVYLFSGSLEKYKSMDAPFLIQDQMLQLGVDKHIPWFNFYGVSGALDGTDQVLKFKQSFNGTIVQKIGTFTYMNISLRAKVYALLKKIR